MLASWKHCEVHDIVYTPSTQPCPVCLLEEKNVARCQYWHQRQKNESLMAEKKELHELALSFKKTLRTMRDKVQERSIEIFDRREKIAKVLGINTECESWWDTPAVKQDEQILEAIQSLVGSA